MLISNAQIKNARHYISTPSYMSMAQRLRTRATFTLCGTMNRTLRNDTGRQTSINVIYRPVQNDSVPAILQSTGRLTAAEYWTLRIRKEN
jgi:hypothetical protein